MLKKAKKVLFALGAIVIGVLAVLIFFALPFQAGSKIPGLILMVGTGLICAGIALDTIDFKREINEKRRELEREGCPLCRR